MNNCQHCKYKIVDFGELCSKGYKSKFKENGKGCEGYKEKIYICETCKKVIALSDYYNEYYCSKDCEGKGLLKQREEKEKALVEKKELEEKLKKVHGEIEKLNEMVDIKVLLEKSIKDIKSLTDEENGLLVKYTKVLNERGYIVEAMSYLTCYYGI